MADDPPDRDPGSSENGGGTIAVESVPVLEVAESGDEVAAIREAESLPEAMPVLPLRETVAYPDTLTPLGVGQERSIKLVDDV
ncbi:MAG: LON peptidase substrate-binding domain-containing protein, partial [Thermoleophilia bacterium]|nr:LON peptidase substrate-binding domain-containing protein [Thermoleophilia bacterium]